MLVKRHLDARQVQHLLDLEVTVAGDTQVVAKGDGQNRELGTSE